MSSGGKVKPEVYPEAADALGDIRTLRKSFKKDELLRILKKCLK